MLKSAEPTPEEFGNTDVSFGTSEISILVSPAVSLPQKVRGKGLETEDAVLRGSSRNRDAVDL